MKIFERKTAKGLFEIILGALFIGSVFMAAYMTMRNAQLEKDVVGFCSHVEKVDQEALLRAGIAVLTKGKPYQYEEALANPKLPYAMQEIEERLESLSSEDKSAADLIYVRHVTQNFKELDRSCDALLRDR